MFSRFRLRSLREREGLSRRDLAVRIGRCYTSVVGYEEGLARPSLEVIERIAGALKVHAGELFDTMATPTRSDESQQLETVSGTG